MVTSSLFGLIGRNIDHSFSAEYFNKKFQREGIDASYALFNLESVEEMTKIIDGNENLKGLNITSPFKREVIPLLDSLSEEAEFMRSVNVIRVLWNASSQNKDILLKGYNTDAEGFRLTLYPLYLDKNKKALILGTGGAASAVEYALRKEGIDYDVVSRTPLSGQLGYDEAAERLPEYQLIVNATPVGMYPDIEAVPPLSLSLLDEGHICYDLIYNPSETRFLALARQKGAKTVNGLQMLHNQADLAWKIWNADEG